MPPEDSSTVRLAVANRLSSPISAEITGSVTPDVPLIESGPGGGLAASQGERCGHRAQQCDEQAVLMAQPSFLKNDPSGGASPHQKFRNPIDESVAGGGRV